MYRVARSPIKNHSTVIVNFLGYTPNSAIPHPMACECIILNQHIRWNEVYINTTVDLRRSSSGKHMENIKVQTETWENECVS